jgi:hypothetical protein
MHIGTAIISAVIAFTSASVPRIAVADQISFFSTGAGKQTCADYLRASEGLEPNALQYRQSGGRTFVSDNTTYDQWIFGFLSATNFASASNGNAKPDIQARNVEIVGWVRNWCANHPDAPMFEGVHSFINDQWTQRGAN